MSVRWIDDREEMTDFKLCDEKRITQKTVISVLEIKWKHGEKATAYLLHTFARI